MAQLTLESIQSYGTSLFFFHRSYKQMKSFHVYNENGIVFSINTKYIQIFNPNRFINTLTIDGAFKHFKEIDFTKKVNFFFKTYEHENLYDVFVHESNLNFKFEETIETKYDTYTSYEDLYTIDNLAIDTHGNNITSFQVKVNYCTKENELGERLKELTEIFEYHMDFSHIKEYTVKQLLASGIVKIDEEKFKQYKEQVKTKKKRLGKEKN